MDLLQAIKERHSVRKYIDKPIPADVASKLSASILRINSEQGLNIQMVLEEPKCFASGIWKYGQFSGVRNYLVMAAPKGCEEKIGYYGEELVLLAQTLGLNTCWVGLTYTKIPGTFSLRPGDIVHCMISLGYGADSGKQHPEKALEKFYEVASEAGIAEGTGAGGASGSVAPEWFLNGMKAAVLAPTAVNQQKFKFTLLPGNVVETKTFFSLSGYTQIDLGIVKYHFTLAAGSENFNWK